MRTNELIATVITRLGSDSFFPIAAKIHEEISSIDTAEIYGCTVNQPLDGKKMLLTKATLHLKTDGTEKTFHGIFTKIEQLDTKIDKDGQLVTYYKITLSSQLYLLTLSQHYKVFTDITVGALILKIFQEHNIYVTDKHDGSKEKIHPHLVQFGETDFDFVNRLMAETGIFYTTDHDDQGHRIVLMNNNAHVSSVHDKPIAMTTTVRGDDLNLDEITTITHQSNVIPSTCTILSTSEYKPSHLQQSSIHNHGHHGDIHIFHPALSSIDDVDHKARLSMQRLEWKENIYQGNSTALRLQSGHSFSLRGHETYDLNQSYLILKTTHVFSRLSIDDPTARQFLDPDLVEKNCFYQNTFSAIPLTTPYVTPLNLITKPKIYSVQSAIVVGPDGQDIYTDDLGNVFIRFSWQSAFTTTHPTSSYCRVRVAQNWAGPGYGSFFTPRIGMEVLITFVDGDPDQPIITGCLYSKENQPSRFMTKTPATMGMVSRSLHNTNRHHEFLFSDDENQEFIRLKSSKDFNVHVADTYRTAVMGQRETVIVKGDDRVVLDQGNAVLGITQGDYKICIQNGDFELTLDKGGMSLSCGHNMTLNAGGNLTLNATGDVNIQGKSIALTSASDLDIQATGRLKIDADELNIKSTTITLHAKTHITITAGIKVSMDFPGKNQFFPMAA